MDLGKPSSDASPAVLPPPPIDDPSPSFSHRTPLSSAHERTLMSVLMASQARRMYSARLVIRLLDRSWVDRRWSGAFCEKCDVVGEANQGRIKLRLTSRGRRGRFGRGEYEWDE